MTRPPTIADDAAEDRLRASSDSERRDHGLLAGQQDFDQHDGEEDRERIVGAGFDLERRARRAGAAASPLAWIRKNTAAASVEATTAPTSSASVQLDAEHPVGDRRGQRRGDQHADGRQQSPPAPARCGRSQAACAGRRRTGSAPARSSRPCRRCRTSSNLMPPGPPSPASMPTRRKTSSNGAPKRSATRLDRMPASTSRRRAGWRC